MCFVDLWKAFDKVPREVLELAMRKKGIPDIFVRSAMSLYEGAKTRVGEDSELLEEFEVEVGMLQGSVLSPFLLAVMVDFATEFSRDGALSDICYVLMT